jgi:hypothetical protein
MLSFFIKLSTVLLIYVIGWMQHFNLVILGFEFMASTHILIWKNKKTYKAGSLAEDQEPLPAWVRPGLCLLVEKTGLGPWRWHIFCRSRNFALKN